MIVSKHLYFIFIKFKNICACALSVCHTPHILKISKNFDFFLKEPWPNFLIIHDSYMRYYHKIGDLDPCSEIDRSCKTTFFD